MQNLLALYKLNIDPELKAILEEEYLLRTDEEHQNRVHRLRSKIRNYHQDIIKLYNYRAKTWKKLKQLPSLSDLTQAIKNLVKEEAEINAYIRFLRERILQTHKDLEYLVGETQ